MDQAGSLYVSCFALQRGRVDVYLASSFDHGATFCPSLRVTGTSFDPDLGVQGGKGVAWWIGDYQGLSAGDMVYPLWNDTPTGCLEIFAGAVPAAHQLASKTPTIATHTTAVASNAAPAKR